MKNKIKVGSPGVVGVKQILTSALFPNPHNPRVLFDKLPLQTLRESIKRVGILVPLTVYWDPKKSRYIILDGQRRWICAQEIGLKEVPVNQVEEPTLVQNILTMFQIHKLRADWELMPTALKIKLLMMEIGDRNDKRLAVLTGLDDAVIVRCKKLIFFDNQFQDMMLDPDPDKRIKADFFIELYSVIQDREVVKFSWFSQNKFIRQMLAKYLNEPRTIKSVTDFRIIKQHISNAKRVGAVEKFSILLREFSEQHEKTLASLDIEEASVRAEVKTVVKKVTNLESIIEKIDVEQFYGEEDLWQSISRLIKVMEKKLHEANKRR